MQNFCIIIGFLAFVGFLVALIVEAIKKTKRGIKICEIGIGVSVFVFLLGLFGDTVSSFIGMLGFFGGLISLIMFVVNLVRRNNKIAYIFVATFLVSCVLFAAGVSMDVSPSQDNGKAEPDSGTTDSLMSAEEQSIVDILRDNDAFDAVFSVTKNDSGKYDVLGMYTKYPDRWSDVRWCAIDAAGLLNSVNQYHPEIYAQLGEVKLNFSISAGNGYFTKIAVPDYADGNSIQFTDLNDADDVVTVTPEDMEKARQELKESQAEDKESREEESRIQEQQSQQNAEKQFAEIYKAYKENELVADEKYKDNRYTIRAEINNITTDGLLNIGGGATLSMEAKVDNTIVFFYAEFEEEQEDSLKKVKVGDTITFEGTCLSAGSWADCIIVE